VQLPGGKTVIREFECLRFSSKSVGVQDNPADPAGVQGYQGYSHALLVPGECSVPEAGISISAKIMQTPVAHIDPGTQVALDEEAVQGLLYVRSRLPGDRYGGPPHRKVKKMLIDARIPGSSRHRLPMIVSGSAVIWIPGFRPAKSFAVRPNSSRFILLELQRD
jgi:tRNA(Ile)-lysidine synthetase-like protein